MPSAASAVRISGSSELGTSTWTAVPPDAPKVPDGALTSATVRLPASSSGVHRLGVVRGGGGCEPQVDERTGHHVAGRCAGECHRDGSQIEVGRRAHRRRGHQLAPTDSPDRHARPPGPPGRHAGSGRGRPCRAGRRPPRDPGPSRGLPEPVRRASRRRGRSPAPCAPPTSRAAPTRRPSRCPPGAAGRASPGGVAVPPPVRAGPSRSCSSAPLSSWCVAAGGHPAACGPPRTEHCGQPGPGASACHTAVMSSRFLTLADVTEVLNISAPQAYALVRSGELPAIQIGGRLQWRVESTELEKYIQRMYEQTRARISSDGSTIDDGADGLTGASAATGPRPAASRTPTAHRAARSRARRPSARSRWSAPTRSIRPVTSAPPARTRTTTRSRASARSACPSPSRDSTAPAAGAACGGEPVDGRRGSERDERAPHGRRGQQQPLRRGVDQLALDRRRHRPPAPAPAGPPMRAPVRRG